MEQKTPWWRYPLTIIVFIVLFFVVPILANLVLAITNIFSPKAYKNTQEWMYILSTMFGVGVACGSLEALMKNSHYVFCMTLSIILAIYLIAVSVWNFAISATELFHLIGQLCGACVSIYYAVNYGREAVLKEEKEKTTN